MSYKADFSVLGLEFIEKLADFSARRAPWVRIKMDFFCVGWGKGYEGVN